ncbi:MAG: hemolysin III family protein [Saprospiraceae bacterium]|nr:hemolysin III family protein [Saprospiraceae bacterium]
MHTTDTEQALQYELANSLTHGFGILFGIVSIPLLITTAAQSGNMAAIVGSSVCGFCFLMLYTFSTLYHGFQHPMVKRALMICMAFWV